ncbi:MAG: hypothetical protein S4CHLAM20_05090 [Chlamydiia bacterium]|nr:hypothetical protein [Chlamydiia bacterium]
MESFHICRKQLIPPHTDLRNLSVVSDFPKLLHKYPEPDPHHNFEVFYGKNNHNEIKKLAKGGNGVVYLVEWKKTSRTRRGIPVDDKIIFKYPITEPEYEPDTITRVLKGYHHDIIPFKIIHDQHGNPFVIMQQASGDVTDLLEYNPSTNFRNKMIAHYASAILQLWRKRIVFTDMKPENLLYQCKTSTVHGGSSDAGISLFFGDVGAFASEGDEEYDYEVEPPEASGKIDKNFCLFTLGLMVIGMYDLRYHRPDVTVRSRNYIGSFEKNFYQPIREQAYDHIKNTKIRNMTLRLLSPDRKDRDTLTVSQAVSDLLH